MVIPSYFCEEKEGEQRSQTKPMLPRAAAVCLCLFGSAVQLPSALTKIFTLVEADTQKFQKQEFNLLIYFSTFWQALEHSRPPTVRREP